MCVCTRSRVCVGRRRGGRGGRGFWKVVEGFSWSFFKFRRYNEMKVR